MKLKLESKFWKIFGTETGYKQLDERKRLTAAKVSELLLVLEYPELHTSQQLSTLYFGYAQLYCMKISAIVGAVWSGSAVKSTLLHYCYGRLYFLLLVNIDSSSTL